MVAFYDWGRRGRATTVGRIRLLLGLGALDAAGYSVIVPVTPEIADATGAGPATIGLLVASFPVGMVAGFWLAGRAVRAARRPPGSCSPRSC